MRDSVKKHILKQLPGLTALASLIIIAGAVVVYSPTNSKLSPTVAQAGTANLSGYAWSDNIGWISFSGTAADSSTYGVTVNTATGVLSGYAWSDNIGWINFGSNACGAQATMTVGALSGFAQATANGSGWDGCISLNGASPNYGVTLSGSSFGGYAWGSDTVGWISFNCNTGGPTGNNICATSNYAVNYSGTPTPTCTLSASPNPAATGSGITLNYTTTNSPTNGTIKDASNNTVYSGVINSSGGISATAPSSPGTYTYTMTVSSLSGAGGCSTSPGLTASTDICTDIPGLQTSLPTGCAGPSPSSPGSCVPSGYAWSGSQCAVIPPTVSSFSGPSRVRQGSRATLTYLVNNPPGSCSVVGTTATTTTFSTNISPTNGVPGTLSAPIYANTKFTLTCSGVSASATVGITPTFQEQ